MAELKPGDTVKLKSGGMLMTITEIRQLPDSGSVASCIWHNDGKEHYSDYPLIALKPFVRQASVRGT